MSQPEELRNGDGKIRHEEACKKRWLLEAFWDGVSGCPESMTSMGKNSACRTLDCNKDNPMVFCDEL